MSRPDYLKSLECNHEMSLMMKSDGRYLCIVCLEELDELPAEATGYYQWVTAKRAECDHAWVELENRSYRCFVCGEMRPPLREGTNLGEGKK